MPADIILGLIWITQLTRSYSPGAGSTSAVWKWGWEPHFPGCETQGTLFSQHSLGQTWLWKTDEFWWSSCTLTDIPLFQHAVISEKMWNGPRCRDWAPSFTLLPAHRGLVIMGSSSHGPRTVLGAHCTPLLFCSLYFALLAHQFWAGCLVSWRSFTTLYSGDNSWVLVLWVGSNVFLWIR